MPDYYQILDLPRSATKEQIKKAYRKKALEYHPDRNASPEAHARFLRITEAYEALMGMAPKKSRKRPQPSGYAPQTDYNYYEFYEHIYSPEAEERRRAAKERVDRQTERQFEHFQRTNEAFRQSWQYKLIQGASHSLRLGILLLGLGCLVLAYVVGAEGNILAWGLVSFPLLLMGALVVYSSLRSYWKNRKKNGGSSPFV